MITGNQVGVDGAESDAVSPLEIEIAGHSSLAAARITTILGNLPEHIDHSPPGIPSYLVSHIVD